MNELMERCAKLWRANVNEMMGKGRQQYVNRARHTFVFVALMRGYSLDKICEFTKWDKDKVNYYAGKAISEEATLMKMLDSGIIAVDC